MARLPALSREALSPAQREIYNRIAAGARGGVRGPFTALLHSPRLAGLVEQLGVYLRFQCIVPDRQRELAILVCAAHWRSGYEWYAHVPLARRQGLGDDVLSAIGRGDPAPPFDEEADRLVFAFCRTSLETGFVPDALYGAVRELLGEPGLVDLTGLVGYYGLLALVLNVFGVLPPEPPEIPFPDREGQRP
jgi:4-carboxymuconolactone decarboxylase